MFMPIFRFIKRSLIKIGVIDPPRGEGKLFVFYLKAVPGTDLKKMKKFWDKAFDNTEWSRKDSGLFSSVTFDGGYTTFEKIDGILFYKIKKIFSKPDSPYIMKDWVDRTEYYKDKEQKQFRLDKAKEREKIAIESGDPAKMVAARQDVEEAKSELGGLRYW